MITRDLWQALGCAVLELSAYKPRIPKTLERIVSLDRVVTSWKSSIDLKILVCRPASLGLVVSWSVKDVWVHDFVNSWSIHTNTTITITNSFQLCYSVLSKFTTQPGELVESLVRLYHFTWQILFQYWLILKEFNYVGYTLLYHLFKPLLSFVGAHGFTHSS